jgi:hypothetical protein
MLEQKTQVSESESGNTETSQVSTETGQTNVTPDDFEVDLSKTYKINPLTGESYTGQEIRQRINESKLFRQKQSDFDKATAEMQKKEETYKAEIQRLETARQLAEANSRISKIENQKAAEDDTYDPYAPLEEEKPTMQYQPVINPVRQPVQSDPDEIEKRVLSKVDEILDKERQQRAQIEAVQNFTKAEKEARRIEIKRNYNVLTDDEVNEIINNDDVATRNTLDANNYITTNPEEAFRLVSEANKYRQRAINLLAKAEVKQERYDTQQQRQKEIMTRSTAQQEKLVYSEKPTTNPADEKKARQSYREIAEANAEQRRIMKSAG